MHEVRDTCTTTCLTCTSHKLKLNLSNLLKEENSTGKEWPCLNLSIVSLEHNNIIDEEEEYKKQLNYSKGNYEEEIN